MPPARHRRVRAVEAAASTSRRPFPMTIKRALVNGKPRIEISGAPAEQLAWLKSLGCFTEIIQYRTRVFVPVDRAADVLSAVLKDA